MIYDLAIIGGGPAGVSAGIYAARKQIKTVFITKDFQGQSSVSLDIQNWIGIPHITGAELSKSLEKHLKEYSGDFIDIKTGELAQSVEKKDKIFEIKTNKNSYSARTILVTSGSRRRELDVPGAKEFDNKGLTYCASCDGPMFSGVDVAVVGGGNAGFDTAAQLLAYCKSVTLIDSFEFRADPSTIEKTKANPKFKCMDNTDILEVKGEKFVNAISLKDKKSGKVFDIPVGGIFVEIGSVPNSDFVKNLVTLDKRNHIVVNPKNQNSSVPEIWAAGDVCDGLYHQNNIAVGDAVKAAEDIYLFLHKNK